MYINIDLWSYIMVVKLKSFNLMESHWSLFLSIDLNVTLAYAKYQNGEKKEFAIFNYMFSFWKRIITQIIINQNDMVFI